MSEQPVDLKAVAVIEAARALAAGLTKELHAEHALQAALRDATEAEALLHQHEHRVAELDVELARLKLEMIEQKRALVALDEGSYKLLADADQARLELWSMAMSDDAEAILEAARRYGEDTRIYFHNHEERQRLQREISRLDGAIKDTFIKRLRAIECRDSAAARQETAADALHSARCNKAESFSLYYLDLQRSLADAAEQYTGVAEQGFAYSYVKPSHLPGWNDWLASLSTACDTGSSD